eukprot:359913-Chlamydomonas_euryale.AAC.5
MFVGKIRLKYHHQWKSGAEAHAVACGFRPGLRGIHIAYGMQSGQLRGEGGGCTEQFGERCTSMHTTIPVSTYMIANPNVKVHRLRMYFSLAPRL